MDFRRHLTRAALASLFVAGLAASVAAQGRVGGEVKDEQGKPIKGAKIEAQNPSAPSGAASTTTDDKGRFSFFLRPAGLWTLTASAPGFAPETGKLDVKTIGSPNPPVSFTLKKGGGAAPGNFGGLTGQAAKDLQTDLQAADQAYNDKQWDTAIEKYKAILAKAPTLSVINLQIAAAYRNKKDYDSAIAAYNDVLKADPNNDKAKIGIGMTNLEKGDLKAADQTLTEAAQSMTATKEVFYNLGEVKFAEGQADEAAKWYQKAADMDANWGKPLFKLGLVALNKGDKDGARKMFEKVVQVDPMSAEAAQAKAVIEQLK